MDEQSVINDIKAVNLDQVTIHTIHVQIRHYRDEPLFDDEGHPLLDEQGNQLTGRKAALRTAHIQQIVPIDIYQQALLISTDNQISEGERLAIMTNIVLHIWKISEKWMTRERLVEGIEFRGIIALFTRFFDSENLL